MRLLRHILTATVSILITIYAVRAFEARNMKTLEVEHRLTLAAEFEVEGHAALDWNAYQYLDQEVLKELHDRLSDRRNHTTDLNRHSFSSKANPEFHETNWNLSYRIDPERILGSAVLLHGLTDSPYSVRSLATVFSEKGLVAFAPRLPGHGFAVGDLRTRTQEDWSAVVELTMRAADKARTANQPLVIAGYSNGAILALDYAINCQTDRSMPCPDAILLLSPAIAVSPFAWFGRLHEIVSWSSYFEQFQWASINPEVDPYKFTSFPKNAGWETANLAAEVRSKLSDGNQALPPILAFQSVVDATVSTDAVLDFFVQLPRGGHELVFYDLNRFRMFSDWMIRSFEDVEEFQIRGPFEFDVTVLSNRSVEEKRLSEYRMRPGSTRFGITDTQFSWPQDVYSMSHISLPFPPNDPIYGENGQAVGTVHPKGERDMLFIDADYFQRMRYNPFFDYQRVRLERWLEDRFVASQSAHASP